MYHFVTVKASWKTLVLMWKKFFQIALSCLAANKSLENKEQFFFRVAICSFAWSVFFTLEKSNSSSLFILILAKIDICFGLSLVAGLELIEFLQLVLLLRLSQFQLGTSPGQPPGKFF